MSNQSLVQLLLSMVEQDIYFEIAISCPLSANVWAELSEGETMSFD